MQYSRNISLAIPTYNSRSYLEKYLPLWKQQEFQSIFIFDDASDDGTKNYIKEHHADVTYRCNEKNIGPTATRNVILKENCGDIILFADSDIEPASDHIAHKLREVFSEDEKIAVVGGLVKTENDEPMWWNYGYESHPIRDAKAEVFHQMAQQFADDEQVMSWIVKNAEPYTMNFMPRVKRDVDWVVEMCFAVRADVFKSLGGFDENFVMFHEGPDLCKRIRENGGRVIFAPEIEVIHHDVHTESRDRSQEFINSSRYWYKKHYNVSEEIFDQLIKPLYL